MSFIILAASHKAQETRSLLGCTREFTPGCKSRLQRSIVSCTIFCTMQCSSSLGGRVFAPQLSMFLLFSFLTFVDMLLYKMYALYALYVIVQTIVTACFSTRNGRNRNGFQYHDVIFYSNQITLPKNTYTYIYI
jgi:hypothetical protein